ncbi:MAG: HAMP domain-containing sensor histidine kinase, partial [Pseudomonadota bacterium]
MVGKLEPDAAALEDTISGISPSALRARVEQGYREDALQMTRIGLLLAAVAMALEWIMHLVEGPSDLAAAHGALTLVTLGTAWRLRRDPECFAVIATALLWTVLLATVTFHAFSIGTGDQEMTRLIACGVMIGVGALVMPSWVSHVLLVVSALGLLLLFWLTLPGSFLLSVTVPLGVIAIAGLIHHARRVTIWRRVSSLLLMDALREEQSDRLAADAVVEMATRLGAGFAHHFNNQLQQVQLSADVLDETLAPDHEGRKYLDTIRASSNQAAGMTAALLRYSRRTRPKKQWLRWSDFAQRLVEHIDDAALRVEATELWLEADPEQLLLSLAEIIRNSQQALAPREGVIQVLARADEDWVTLTVMDDGPGIEPGMMKRAADPFVTGNP